MAACGPAQAAGASSPCPEDADGEKEYGDPRSAAQLPQQREPVAQAAGWGLPQALVGPAARKEASPAPPPG